MEHLWSTEPRLRDIVCYLWALYWLVYCLYQGRITLYDSIGFLGTGLSCPRHMQANQKVLFGQPGKYFISYMSQ